MHVMLTYLFFSDFLFFFFNDPPTTEIYTLSLHDALPIYRGAQAVDAARNAGGMDRLVAHRLDGVTVTPDHVHGRLVVHVRRHSDHHLRALPEVPLGRPEDGPPVVRSHDRVHHAAEYRARRHGPQPLDQGVQRRWRTALHHRKGGDRKSTRLNSSHGYISYAVFCLK